MNTALWIAQGVLAVTFLVSGGMKLLRSREQMARSMPVLEDVGPGAFKMIGLAEVLGALGVVLPLWLGILPWLTPLAAAGLVLLMGGAIGAHLRRGEVAMSVPAWLLFLVAGFVAWGRWDLLAG
ncbi:MAG: DoxX family protein [Thermoanaerobaculia bacterium]|nr:DoxX family protein [Thermoanaerobaculia bacterium]